MKIFRKIITSIIAILITFISLHISKVSVLTSSNIYVNNENLTNVSEVVEVAVIFHRGDDPYMMRLKESLENIQKKNQNKVNFTFYNAKNNIAIQNEILDSVLNEKFNLIILNLADKKENTVENVIFNVKQRNIPVILMNIPQNVVEKVSKLYTKAAFVLPDSKKAGSNQGKIIVDLWNNNRKSLDKNGDNILQYVLLKGEIDDPQAIDRSKYVISTINDSGIKTEMLGTIDANWMKEIAKSSFEQLFLKYDGHIESIISNNDAMAIGAIETLQKYGYNKDDHSKYIAVIGIDSLPEAIDLIDKGIMAGSVFQDPDVAAKMLYIIGINLTNNLNPIENTNYKIVDGEIIFPFDYDIYTGRS